MAREWFQALGAELLRVGLETGCLESANEDGSRVKVRGLQGERAGLRQGSARELNWRHDPLRLQPPLQIVAMDHISTKATAFFRLLGRAAGMALFHNKTLNFPCAKMVLQVGRLRSTATWGVGLWVGFGVSAQSCADFSLVLSLFFSSCPPAHHWRATALALPPRAG